jgi:hypothetical protein
MGSSNRYELQRDRKGMMWDLLLYVPTVTALLSMAAKFWYGHDTNVAYLLAFLGSFFFIAGASRILKTRLMLLPSSPIAIEFDKQVAKLFLRNGKCVEMAKGMRYYSDYAGRTFGLSGLDSAGQQRQFIFHKGQFHSEQAYQAAQNVFRVS